ncbi:MAG TPA: LpqB family beta-propeller domain-containing protein [Pyrinomonadaceae bacterium]|jgi:Tol biopolymer transport system component/DNA-binding winged helix-turn-helix (wHTH) protein|nr:LpqB family beta-propeller domain-containing protein [Pyrinomonadaceae bacterium]
MSGQEKHLYEFGPFRLDPVKRRLLRDGEPVQLTPKAFETLLALVEQGGRTVEKEELMRRVWPGTVVEENNLNQNITALRRCLGDSRRASRYIATIPGLGYRFVAEVRTAPSFKADDDGGQAVEAFAAVSDAESAAPAPYTEERELPASVEPSPAPAPDEFTFAAPKSRGKVAAAAVALLLVGTAALALFRTYRRAGGAAAAGEIEVTALTRTGTTGRAAISPDGRHIIYSVVEAGRESLWLRQTSASSVRQIVAPAKVEYLGLTFSRDGNHLYFVSSETNGAADALYRLPTLGGVPSKLLEDVHSPVTLSPDGARLAFVRNAGGESALVVADADGGQQFRLASRPATDNFKFPAWSPDGKVIACSTGSRDRYDFHNGVVVVKVEDGEQSPVSPREWGWTGGVEWLEDGSGLLLTASEQPEGMDQIWHVAYPGGEARRITSDSKRYRTISLTADSRAIVAVQTELNSDIWVAAVSDSARAQKITFGTGSYLDVCYTPDGRVVYASQAGGSWDIWVMNADGTGQRQLTADAGVNAHAIVSPDGRHIAFTSNRAGTFNIWRMDGDGGNPVRLTSGGGEKFPHWSPDGRWVVYNSVSPDESLYSLWKVAAGGGEPVRLTDEDCERPAVSPDGKHVACFHRDATAGNEYRIVVTPFDGGPPERTFDIPSDIVPLPFVRWSPDGQAVTYTAHRDGIPNIWTQPPDGGPARQLTDFKAEGRLRFDWSRDGKQLVFSRHVWTSDLVLLRNFSTGNS